MLFMLLMFVSIILRLNRIEKKVDKHQGIYNDLLREIEEIVDRFDNE